MQIAKLMTVLSHHIGKGNGISAKNLAERMELAPRQLRKLITETIEKENVAICGTPRDGYYIAANGNELIETIEFHDQRAKHELKKCGVLRRMLGELFGQTHLPT